MLTSLIVVDDFLDDPDVLRNAALGLTYPEVKGMYPGRNSVERINLEGLNSEVSRLVGEPLVPMVHNQAATRSASNDLARLLPSSGWPTYLLERDTMDDTKWK